MSILIRLIWRLFPWIIVAVLLLVLYLGGQWPFGGKDDDVHVYNTTTILHEIESIGKLELVKYNFKEILDYQRLTSAKFNMSTGLRFYEYSPDSKLVLIATGEAVGCIDLTKLRMEDISATDSTLTVRLPGPELCYHKLDMENTRVHSFSRGSWWSRLFVDEEEDKRTFELAYQNAEQQIKKAALESGMMQKTKENAVALLKPMLERMTGKQVFLQFDMNADIDLD